MMKRQNALPTSTNISSSLTTSSTSRRRNVMKCSWKLILVGMGLGVVLLQGLLAVLMHRSRESSKSMEHNNQKPASTSKQRAMSVNGPAVLPEKMEMSEGVRKSLVDMEQAVQIKVNEGGASHSVQSCRLHPELDCTTRGDNNKIFVYNPWERERLVVCQNQQQDEQQHSKSIPSKGVISLPPSSCNMMSTRLFPTVPSVENAKELPPTVLLLNPDVHGGSSSHLQIFQDCDIPCHFDHPISINTVRYVQGTPWEFMCSMEGPHYYPSLKYDTQAHLQNHFFATTSYDSEVPLPYYSKAEYDIQKRPPVSFDKGIKGASFLARNCGSRNDREGLVQELISLGFRVDSLSACLHNANLPPGVDSLHDKKLVQAQYLFHLAFENQNEPDYITEKLWGTLESGTLPIYFGAPNVKEHAPPHSVISVHDFNTTQALVEYLNEVMNNRTLYESYHTWRSKPLPASFHEKYDLTNVHSTCRMCRWAFAKRYGLRWNASTQSLASNIGFGRHSPSCRRRRTDASSRSLDETWWKSPTQPSFVFQAGTIVPSSDYDCDGETSGKSQTSPSIQTSQAGGIQRTLSTYDGVLDLLVENIDHNHRNDQPLGVQWLRFASSSGRAELVKDNQDSRRALLQDDSVRWTILTSSDVAMTSPSPGIIDIPISADHLPLRIRFIEEELDLIHEGGTNEVYYFGETMTNDFFNPIELFYVE